MPTTSKPVPLDYRQGDDKPPEGVLGARHSRKRSAKGAKNTKAPMDAEGGCACTGGKKTSKCKSCQGKAMKDGGCGMKRDRADALSAPEYVAACELGIQSRSRTYIRTRLDFNTGEGQGKACGKGFTSKNKQCQKGPGTPVASTPGGPNLAVRAGQATKSVGLGLLEAGKWASGYNIGKALATGVTTGKNEKGSIGSKTTAILGSTLIFGPTAGLGAARRVGGFGSTDLQQHASNQKKEKQWRRSVGYRDSTYAPGFKVDLDQLAI